MRDSLIRWRISGLAMANFNTMVAVGLLQALGMWALASRWVKISLLYGALGLAYWLTLFSLGNTPATLLQAMPLAAGVSFVMVFAFWIVSMRRPKISPSPQT